MTRRAPILLLALACLADSAACRSRAGGSTDSTQVPPLASPMPGDSVTSRDSARVAPPDSVVRRDSARVAARAAADEEDRPCLASRIGLPCAGSDGHP